MKSNPLPMLILLTGLITLGGACGGPESVQPADYSAEPSAALDEVGETIRDWLGAMNQADLDRVAELFSDEITLLPPQQSPVSGRDAVVEDLRAFFETTAVQLTYTSDDRRIDGGLAVERGRLVRALHPRDGNPAAAESYNMVMVLQREAGGWKIVLQAWNSNIPRG